jgi:hypothetical protein
MLMSKHFFLWGYPLGLLAGKAVLGSVKRQAGKGVDKKLQCRRARKHGRDHVKGRSICQGKDLRHQFCRSKVPFPVVSLVLQVVG